MAGRMWDVTLMLWGCNMGSGLSRWASCFKGVSPCWVSSITCCEAEAEEWRDKEEPRLPQPFFLLYFLYILKIIFINYYFIYINWFLFYFIFYTFKKNIYILLLYIYIITLFIYYYLIYINLVWKIFFKI